MKRIALIAASVVLTLALVACGKSTQTTTHEPTKTLLSGVEKENFDATVKHSENFFYSVNGGWLKKVEIPGDKSSYGSFAMLDDGAQLAMRAIIETAAAKSGKLLVKGIV